MKLLILHLSDIHFAEKRRFAASRVGQIVAAALTLEISFERLLIVISGDIAQAGLPTEYAIAIDFLNSLVSKFREAVSHHLEVSVVTVAGNHDLDFSQTGSNVVDVLASDIVRASRNPITEPDLYNTLLQSQSAYTSFQQVVSSRTVTSLPEQLKERFEIHIDNNRVVITGLNTAILSRRNETQGALWYPPELLDLDSESSDLGSNSYSILVYHHPDKWLESNNAVRFRTLTESLADLILIGHQHNPDTFYSESLDGSKSWYSAGEALQGSSEQKSGFAAICLNFADKTRRRVSYTWKTDFFVQEADTQWQPFCKNVSARAGYVLSEKFTEALENPGNLITHPQKKKVSLTDIYEPCRLRARNSNFSSVTSIYGASDIPNLLESHPRQMIFGEAQGGKSVLAKRLFRQLFDGSGATIPLLLNGGDLQSTSEKDVEKWLRKAYQAQFATPSFSRFKSADRASRILIVDDWQNHSNE